MRLVKLLGAVSVVACLAGFSATAQEAAKEAEPVAPEQVVAEPAYIKGGIMHGSMDAPITIIEYASLTCPHCKQFSDEVTAVLEERLIPEGKVRLEFRHLIRDRLDMAVSVALRCTGDVEVSKRLLKTFFNKQVAWMGSEDPRTVITAIAATEGVTEEDLNACFVSKAVVQHLLEMSQEGAETYDISSTPTIIMDGKKMEYSSYAGLVRQIEAASLAAGQ
ncbi:MAG: thioredoxin domain-containing protein [Kordiimonadaceae bacterium]|nr:thioredoxin domain-containing protein [Kordiimonadaceae bacterium]